MMRLALVLALAACSKGRPDDCEVVRKHPKDAPVELSKRYPNNPIKVLEVIETCVAPSGDECDRVAKIVAAIPTMTPQLSVPNTDVAKLCRDSPPEFRRCLVPSYTLQHADECRQVMANISIEKINITPRGPGEHVATDCGFVSIYIDDEGAWLATGRDDKSRCFAPREHGMLDLVWLERELRKAKAHDCGPTSAEIAADDDVSYQEVISVMDVAVKTGFMDTGLSAPDGLAVPLASAKSRSAAGECPHTLIAIDPKDAPTPTSPSPPSSPSPTASGPTRLANAPVLVITREEMMLNIDGKSTAVTAETFSTSLPKASDGLLILQADKSTPSKVINRVVTTAKAAGYDNIMFAVKNR